VESNESNHSVLDLTSYIICIFIDNGKSEIETLIFSYKAVKKNSEKNC